MLLCCAKKGLYETRCLSLSRQLVEHSMEFMHISHHFLDYDNLCRSEMEEGYRMTDATNQRFLKCEDRQFGLFQDLIKPHNAFHLAANP